MENLGYKKPSKDIIRIGFAGLGWIAEKAHIPAFQKQKDVEIVAAFDISVRRCEYIGRMFGIKNVFNDYIKFLDTGMDAVIIATPNYTHADYAIKALERRIHVLCEKPVALSSQEIEKVIEIAERNGCMYIPAFVNRFRYDIRCLKKVVESGVLGEITGIDAGWIRRNGRPRPGSWFTNRRYAGGGVLLDLGSHVLDICMMLIKGESTVKNAEATAFFADSGLSKDASWFRSIGQSTLPIDVEDAVTGSVCTEAGLIINFTLSWLSEQKGDCTYFTIRGDKSTAVLQTLFGYSKENLWEKSHLFICGKDGKKTEIPLDIRANTQAQAFNNQAKAFIDAIGGGRNLVTEKDAYHNVRTIECLYNAMSRGGCLKQKQRLGSAEFE